MKKRMAAILIASLMILISCGKQQPKQSMRHDNQARAEENYKISFKQNYPFFEEGWGKTVAYDERNQGDLYTVTMIDEKLHCTDYENGNKISCEEELTNVLTEYDIGEIYDDGSIKDMFLYEGTVYYTTSGSFGHENYLRRFKRNYGQVLMDDDQKLHHEEYTWDEDENFKIRLDIASENIYNIVGSHYIDDKGKLYLLAEDRVYLYNKKNLANELVFEKEDWNCYNHEYSLVKIDDIFYTGTNGGISSYDPVKKAQWLWVREDNMESIDDEETAEGMAKIIIENVFGEGADNGRSLIVEFDEENQLWKAHTQFGERVEDDLLADGHKQIILGGNEHVVMRKDNAEILAVWGEK